VAGTKHFKAVQKQLAKFGYEFNRCNASSHWIYSQNGREDIPVNPSISDHAARVLLRQVQKLHGTFKATPKHNPAAIKERQAKEREALKARSAALAAERAQILAERDLSMSGLGAILSPLALRALIHRLEQIDRERHAIEKLMRAPVGNSHLGTDRRVQHQAGSRSP
jgi:hypothetical protein